MRPDVTALKAFYERPIGGIALDLVSSKIAGIWSDLTRESVLGIGYPPDLFDRLKGAPERRVIAMPGAQGVARWPAGGPNAAVLVEDDQLPLANCEFTRAILIHALEVADDLSSLLREVWRVLTPGGRVIAVVPCRRRGWAGMDSTPFGYGQPFSRFQIEKQLRDHLLMPVTVTSSLLLPPVERYGIHKLLHAAERAGPWLTQRFGGLLIIEAEKQIWDQGLARTTARKAAPVPAAAQPI